MPFRRSCLRAVLLLGFTSVALSTLGACGRGGGETAVTGTVLYRERMALPPEAVVEVTIEDVSRADAAAEVLGRARIEQPGEPPIAFSVPYDPKRIDARHRYSARARIMVGTELWFTNTQAVPVLTQGNGNRVEILVQRVAATHEGTAPDARGEASGGGTAGTAGAGGAAGHLPAALANLPASFAGDLPCADCSGIRYHLVLFPDRAFFLRMASLGQGADAAHDDIGTWSVSPDGSTLSLHGGREAPVQLAIVDAKTLRKLEPTARAAQSALSHDLTRTEAYQALEPQLALRGMYVYMADAGLFRECLTGQRWPVAQEAANIDLERAYGEARKHAGDEVLATVEGRIVQRPKMEGEGTQTALVVERVVSVRIDQQCPPRPGATPPLEGTAWILALLGDRAVTGLGAEQRPTLALDPTAGRAAGSSGCNQYFATYALTGNGLRFSKMGGTMKACADMTIEDAYKDALVRVVSWRIMGAHLELADANGTMLLRYDARTMP